LLSKPSKAAVTRNFFWEIGKNFAVTRIKISELPKQFLNYELRIGVHDWSLFLESRIAMGTSPNDIPLYKMPLTQVFLLKPAYLHAFTVSQDGAA